MIHKWGESSPHLGLVIIYGARWSELRPPRPYPQAMPQAMYLFHLFRQAEIRLNIPRDLDRSVFG